MKHINNKGFTLVETVVAMGIFVVIMLITATAFKTALKNVSLVNKNEESNIEGVVGLEMFRHDIAQAGFGLPDILSTVPISYVEAVSLPASAYNDTPNNSSCNGVPCSGVPRAVMGGNDLSSSAVSDPNSYNGVKYAVLNGTDYLALKATSLGITSAAQNWTYEHYSSTGSYPKQWGAGSLNANDQVIVINRTFPSSPGASNQLVNPTSTNYWVNYNSAGLGASFSPAQAGPSYYVYGVQSYVSGGNNTLGMPFNRADYFVAAPSDNSLPSSCSPNTGILYKAVVNHKNGLLTYLPIMDCIADMQVVLGWNFGDSSGNFVSSDFATGSGLIDTWSDPAGTAVSSNLSPPPSGWANYFQQTILPDPAHIRTKLKLIKVYILAQEGHLDPNYTSPAAIQISDPNNNEISLVHPTTAGNYNLTSSMLNYRWKVYRLVVKPNNLVSNQ
jgi:prepilin-type N-terminal cleavage/methylation domain-containing protein